MFGHSANNTRLQLLVRISRNSVTNEITTKIVTTYPDLDDIPLIPGSCAVYDSKRNKMWIASTAGNSTNDVIIDYYYIDAITGAIERNVSGLSWSMPFCNYDASLDSSDCESISFNSANIEFDGNIDGSVININDIDVIDYLVFKDDINGINGINAIPPNNTPSFVPVNMTHPSLRSDASKYTPSETVPNEWILV